MYDRYFRPPSVHHQRGHGIGSFLARFALPTLRKLAPIVKSTVKHTVKKHGPRVAKQLGRAALKAAASGDKKAALKREVQHMVAQQLRQTKPRRKKPRKRRHHKDIFGAGI